MSFWESSANVLASVVLIAVFNIILYFTYTTRIEENVIKLTAKRLVNDLTYDARVLLPPGTLDKIATAVGPYLQYPDLSKEDAEVDASNKALTQKTIKVVSIASAIGVTLVAAIVYFAGLDVWEILKRNLLIIFFVALLEVVFLTFIVQYYITVDANFVKATILQAFIDFGQGKKQAS